MMEYWNTGIMGSGMMQCRINGRATGGSDYKIKMVKILLKYQYSNVPPFHYSILGANSESTKNLYILS